MYSKELETLIEAAIEDGTIDETAQAVLIKRAEREGVDINELTIYVNSLLKKRRREAEAERISKVQTFEKEKKEAIGNICPKCGQQIPPMSIVCPYCGYEIVKKEANSSVQDLLKKIEEINNQHANNNNQNTISSLGSRFLDVLDNGNTKKIELGEKEQRIIDTISMHPVPNTKEDILEFLSLSASHATQKFQWYNTLTGRIILTVLVCLPLVPVYGLGLLLMGLGIFAAVNSSAIKETSKGKKRQNAWITKFKQVLMKGRSITGDDAFQKQLDYYEGILKK